MWSCEEKKKVAQKQRQAYGEYIKNVPFHPRKRLKRKADSKSISARKKTTIDLDVEFIKIVPEHPRDRLKRKTKT